MDSRSHESPMDWEYQHSGPYDPTSPFTHAAKGTSQHIFNRTTKVASLPNAFAGLSSPSKPQPPVSQSFCFSPQRSSKSAASPFRNPAFTTPRRPVDEVVLSEASGAEDSPALTEASDFPDDTPDAERRDNVYSTATVTPLKIDKLSRYEKFGPTQRKYHTSGKGEIRRHKELALTTRKRRRHNYDKDVGGVVRHSSQDWDCSETDSDGSFTSRARSRDAETGRGGIVRSLFQLLDEHPHTPDNLSRWIQLMVNFFLVSSCIYIFWSVVQSARTDIRNSNEAAKQAIMAEILVCQTKYEENRCIDPLPALKESCLQWHDCIYQDPESIMRIKATVKQVAEIINEFSETMNLKAWALFAVIFLCASVVNMMPGRPAESRPVRPPSSRAASNAHDISMTGGNASGSSYMLMPIQTPRMQRYGLQEEGTDTDTSPPNHKPILLPPYTPSGRRSPSKGERTRSPVKFNRSPSKG